MRNGSNAVTRTPRAEVLRGYRAHLRRPALRPNAAKKPARGAKKGVGKGEDVAKKEPDAAKATEGTKPATPATPDKG